VVRTVLKVSFSILHSSLIILQILPSCFGLPCLLDLPQDLLFAVSEDQLAAEDGVEFGFGCGLLVAGLEVPAI